MDGVLQSSVKSGGDEPFLLLLASYMPSLNQLCLTLPSGITEAGVGEDPDVAVQNIIYNATGDRPLVKVVASSSGQCVGMPCLGPERTKVVVAEICRNRGFCGMQLPWCGLRNGPRSEVGRVSTNGAVDPGCDQVRCAPSTQARAPPPCVCAHVPRHDAMHAEPRPRCSEAVLSATERHHRGAGGPARAVRRGRLQRRARGDGDGGAANQRDRPALELQVRCCGGGIGRAGVRGCPRLLPAGTIRFREAPAERFALSAFCMTPAGPAQHTATRVLSVEQRSGTSWPGVDRRGVHGNGGRGTVERTMAAVAPDGHPMRHVA